MFKYVLNMPLSLVLKEVWVDEEAISIILMKNQQKVKALLNGTNTVNMEQWIKMYSTCVETKSITWNTLNYWLWDTVIWMQSLREFKSAAREIVHLSRFSCLETLINLNSCTIGRTGYSAPEVDLELLQLLELFLVRIQEYTEQKYLSRM